MRLNRREFCRGIAAGCMAALLNPLEFPLLAATEEKWIEAQHYEVLPDGQIHCLLCPNGCYRTDGIRSKCRGREPKNGKYYSLVYGKPCVLSVDPVEKCPLFHYRVPSPAFSIATAGCNLSCQYCQNWQFSQSTPEEARGFVLPPAKVIEKALEYKTSAIAFFYTEPTIYFEYMKDIAVLAKEKKLTRIMVTGGYINEAPLKELFPLIDAFVVGLKGFTEDYYGKVVGGTLEPVLRTLKLVKSSGRHLEVVTLLVPTLNDDMKAIQAEIEWYTKNLGPEIPLHFTRFNPQYKLRGLPPTPVSVLEQARNLAIGAGLKYVYTGNVPGHEGNHTYCPACKTIVIERLGFKVLKDYVEKGKCPKCGAGIAGIW